MWAWQLLASPGLALCAALRETAWGSRSASWVLEREYKFSRRTVVWGASGQRKCPEPQRYEEGVREKAKSLLWLAWKHSKERPGGSILCAWLAKGESVLERWEVVQAFSLRRNLVQFKEEQSPAGSIHSSHHSCLPSTQSSPVHMPLPLTPLPVAA